VYGNSTTTNGYAIYGTCTGANCFAGYFNGNLGGSGTYSYMSDERLKKDIVPLVGAESTEKLLRLRGVSFRWREPAEHGNATGVQRGFIAQEFERVFPEWVTTDSNGIKLISTTGLDALEVEAIRTLKAENDDLKARVQALEDARRPTVSMNMNGLGVGVAGIAIAGALVIGRRRREQESVKAD
jgi:hypothetical protein